MYATTYHRPSSVDEAASLFAKGAEAKYLAGGHTLIPVMKQRLARPSDVIDLARIKDMVGIELSADALTIKAATTYFDIMESPDVKKAIPAIAGLTSTLGDPAVRYRGTIGGSIANNDPAADFPAALLALGATVKTKAGDIRVAATGASQDGVMRVPAIETALKANWSAVALDGVKISSDGLLSDIHGSAAYRANLVKVMAQRAVTAAG